MMPPNPTRGDRPSWAAAIGIGLMFTAAAFAAVALVVVAGALVILGIFYAIQHPERTAVVAVVVTFVIMVVGTARDARNGRIGR